MLISLDVGYSHTKAAIDGKRVIFPSVVGEAHEVHFDPNLVNSDRYLDVEMAAGRWLVGETAMMQSGLGTRRQDRGWIESPEYLALALAAMTELTEATRVSVDLVTGLPIAYYADADALAHIFLGEHVVKRVGGRGVQRFQVERVTVLPQGFAAVLSVALDESGRVLRGPVAEGTIGLVDVGGHTVNLATFQALREIPRKTASVEAGTWIPLETMRRSINATYPGLELDGHEVSQAAIAGAVGYYGKAQDVAAIVQDALAPFARKVLGVCTELWGSAARLDAVLVAGGGAKIVAPVLRATFPHLQVVDDPQWANVRGYLRFGRRLGREG